MDFNNVRVLGYNHNSIFFGSNNFRFKTNKNLSIEGTIVDLTSINKLSTGIWTEADLLSNFSQYEPVVINGENFGSGKMESLNFEVGQDIDSKNYTANISIFSTGNLFNLTGEFYTGIDKSSYHYINDLTEDFSYNSEGPNKNYTQRIIINCSSGDSVNPLILAKNIAANLFATNSITGLISDYNNINLNPKYSESINLINNTYQVDKTVSLSNESGAYSLTRNHLVSLGGDGTTVVEEKGEIKGLEATDPWNAALTGLQSEIQTAYNRCNDVYSVYKDASAVSLNSKIINLNENLNRFTDSIDYSISFDNKKENINNGYSHEQTTDIIKQSDDIIEVSVRGSLFGWGLNYLQQFEEAKTGYDSLIPTFKTTAQNFLELHSSSFLDLKTLSSSVTFSRFNGSIAYDYIYTTDYSYKETENFKKEEISISDDYKNDVINKYGIINVKEIIQNTNIKSISVRNLNLNISGKRNVLLSAYLARARDIINSYIPGNAESVIDVFISSLNYNFNPKTYKFNLNVIWEYTSNFILQKTDLETPTIIVN